MTGVHAVESGFLYVDGEPHIYRSPADARNPGIATVVQDPALLTDLTVGRNLGLRRTGSKAFRKG